MKRNHNPKLIQISNNLQQNNFFEHLNEQDSLLLKLKDNFKKKKQNILLIELFFLLLSNYIENCYQPTLRIHQSFIFIARLLFIWKNLMEIFVLLC